MIALVTMAVLIVPCLIDDTSDAVAYEEIDKITITGLDVPGIGDISDNIDWSKIAFGGEYGIAGTGFEKHNGTEWVPYNEITDVVNRDSAYRIKIILQPYDVYIFSSDLTDDDITINGEKGKIGEYINAGNKKFISVYYEYETNTDEPDYYGIAVATKVIDEGTEVTSTVDVTSENCEDVLGNGTVSYDPTTKTLTLNNYVYNGDGLEGEVKCAIEADSPTEGLSVVLVGTNSITVNGSSSAGMVFFGDGDLTIKGNGSLTINVGMQGLFLADYTGKIKIDSGNIDITTTTDASFAIATEDFIMNGGNLKITTKMFGIVTLSEDGTFCINGGSLEISTAWAGYSFVYVDIRNESYNPVTPDLSGYVGEYDITASAKQDGSDAVVYDEYYISTYKYIKIAGESSGGSEPSGSGGSGDDGGLSTGVIVGIVVGVIAVIGVGVFFFIKFKPL